VIASGTVFGEIGREVGPDRGAEGWRIPASGPEWGLHAGRGIEAAARLRAGNGAIVFGTMSSIRLIRFGWIRGGLRRDLDSWRRSRRSVSLERGFKTRRLGRRSVAWDLGGGLKAGPGAFRLLSYFAAGIRFVAEVSEFRNWDAEHPLHEGVVVRDRLARPPLSRWRNFVGNRPIGERRFQLSPSI